jgi:predicted amidohydrolase
MLKIAQIQYSPILGEIEQNTEKAKLFIEKCDDSELIILPELADTGYNFFNKDHALKVSRPIIDNPFINMLIEQAKQSGSNIVSGFSEKKGDQLYNSSILVSPSGIIGKYSKVHLFMNEKDIFEEGEGGMEVFSIGNYKLGMQICFDYLFAEPWNILAQKEADIIVHPSNLVTYNAFKVIPALAVMNKVFIATTNRIGIDRDLKFAGKSFLCDPNGSIVSEASADQEEILFSEIDIDQAKNKMITERNHVFKDKRPDKYW